MSSYVLVHGGLHGAWCWERIIAPLRDAGHAVEAVDLPGRDGVAAGDYGAYVDVVADAVGRAAPPVVLVGHSLGGVACSQFAERDPAAVERIVLVNALLVEDGEAAFAKLQAAGAESLLLRPGLLRISPDGRSVTISTDDAVPTFYNRCGPADAEWAAARLCAEPIAPLTVPLTISAAGFGSVPKIYFGSRADRVLPWSFQQRMSSAAGAELIELAGDHSPFLLIPEAFVRRLQDTAK